MNQEKIWDAFQNDPILLESFKQARFRHLYLIDIIFRKWGGEMGGGREGEPVKILNIGIGDGGFEMLCLERGVAIYSLDPSAQAIERLNKITNHATIGYSDKIPFEDRFFDFVVMSEVVEHLSAEVLKTSLYEIKRVLKKNGYFIGTTPADENLADSIAVCPKCGERFHKFGHQQSFSRDRLEGLLSEMFSALMIERRSFADPKLLNIKGKIMRLVKIVLMKFGIYGANEQFVWEAQNGL